MCGERSGIWWQIFEKDNINNVRHSAGKNGGKVANTTTQADIRNAIHHFIQNVRRNVFKTSSITSMQAHWGNKANGPKFTGRPPKWAFSVSNERYDELTFEGMSFCRSYADLAADPESMAHSTTQ